MDASIVLILGAGPGIGASVAARFSVRGFQVAAAARSLHDRRANDSRLEIKMDLRRAEDVRAAFGKVVKEFGKPPSVVIYNAASRTLVPADDPIADLSMNDLNDDLSINLTSAVVAAQEAVRGFKILPDTASKAFIYTGNKLNVMADPKALPFGIARTGAAHFLWDCSVAYEPRGFRFYFTDERLDDGRPARELMDPEARAELYLRLSESDQQGPWHYTFVKNRGYVDFRSTDGAWQVK